MAKGKHKKKIEFSKIILLVVGAINIIVLTFACYMIKITGDVSPFAYIIPALAAEAATGTGFYYNKAKAENQIKLQNAYEKTEAPVEDASYI